MPITPLPTPPQPTDTTAQFNTKAFAFVAALAQFVTESNLQAAEVDADAVLAQLGKTEALAAAAAAAAVAGATRWDSGTTYTQGAAVWSPITFLTYRRRTAGAGTTDPSADSTNWTQVAGTGDVSQAGVQTLTNKTLGSGSTVTTQPQGNNSSAPASTAYIDRLTGTAGAIGFRNRIINGECRVAQRAASATAVSGQYVAVDRFRTSQPGTTAVVTMSQSTDAPAGFQNSLRLTVATADASVATGDAFVVQQLIEGFNCADLIGQPFTLSFWVRSAKTGIHCVSFANAGADRSYLLEYTVNAANTWEYKTLTVTPGLITAGTTNYTNGAGVDVRWSLMGGATFQATAGVWQTGNFTNTANQVNVLDTAGNVFAITGVQLEAGSIATPFERVDHGEMLRRCQRYFEKTYNQAVVPGTATDLGAFFCARVDAVGGGGTAFKVAKRAAPSVIVYSPVSGAAGFARNYSNNSDTAASAQSIGESGFYLLAGSAINGQGLGIQYAASAEL